MDGIVKFIAKDLRPFNAIDGERFVNLMKAMIYIVQKYPFISEENIRQILPCRKSAKNYVNEYADNMKHIIANSLKKAISNPGGFSCTADMWSDDYVYNSY